MAERTCRWPGCEDGPGRIIRGLCSRHYSRAKRAGNFEDPWVTWTTAHPYRGRVGECRWPDCGSVDIKGHGLCNLHNRRARDVGDMREPWAIWGQPRRCVVCGEPTDRRANRFCSNACNLIDWKSRNRERYLATERERVRRRRALIATTAAEVFTDKEVRATYGDDCYLCGKVIDFDLLWPHPKSPSLDHITPLSRGGAHTLDNCAMTHLVCNHKKGARLIDRRPQPLLLTQ